MPHVLPRVRREIGVRIETTHRGAWRCAACIYEAVIGRRVLTLAAMLIPPDLGNSRRETERLSLVLWIPSAAARIFLRALSVARREFEYTRKVPMGRPAQDNRNSLTSSDAKKEHDIQECVPCQDDLQVDPS